MMELNYLHADDIYIAECDLLEVSNNITLITNSI